MGSPVHQVIRSKPIAPSSAGGDGGVAERPGLRDLCEIVSATLVPKKMNAAKLKNAAHATACFGVSTRVDTTVAMEFAASWNPLM